jgi:DNA-binding winged helix-turn-helix (wHTH) protein/tetratricopeptide (TPR) repeat protein
MAMPNGFIVGEWTVAPSRNLLVRADEEVHVEPRVMDVLVLLAERAGQPVSKDDLIDSVWKRQYVTDDVLTVTIYNLRKALGDDARQPRYIETVSRRGYRLVAPVSAAPPASAPAAALTQTEAPTPMEPLARQPRRFSWQATSRSAALVLFAAGAVWAFTFARHVRHVPPAEAHEAYLKGRYFLDQRSVRGWQQALDQFQRAVALDPQDPAAHAALADTYSAMSDFGVATPEAMRPRAMKEARYALELEPRSAEGLAALGRAQFLFDWDFAAAERNLARAAELDPDYMPAQQTMAWLKSALGQHAEAIAAAQRALQLDPVNTARYTELAWVLALGGRHDEALRQIDRALQLNPRSFGIYLMRAWAWEQKGQPDSSFAAYREAMSLSGAPEESLRQSEAAYRAGGLRGFYRYWLNKGGRGAGGAPMSDTFRAQMYARVGSLDRQWLNKGGGGARGPMSDTFRAQMYARVGNLDSAITSLERAYQKREGALAWVNVEPSFQPLRSDARFQQIAARVTRRD